jgi:predicted TIM-barrel fold metal-dependent hydrolase
MKLTRRQYLQQTAASAVAAAAASCPWPAAGGEDDQQLPIIDTHQHLWDLVHLRPTWIRRSKILSGQHATEQYLQAVRGLNITRAIYMEIALPPEEHREEVAYVTSLCRSDQHPTFAAVIGGRLAEEGFASYVRDMATNRYVKGVRQVLHSANTPPGFCLRKPFVRSVQLLGELGLRFDLCMRPAELGDGARLVDQCPDTRFVLDHCGNADPKAFLPASHPAAAKAGHDPETWKRGIAQLAARPNVACKISGVVARVPEQWDAEMLAPPVNYCLDQFGPERVVFGSDWPVCKTAGATLAQWVAALRTLIRSRPLDQQRRLLSENVAAVYGV